MSTVHRYRSRAIVKVCSHITDNDLEGKIDLSLDAISINTSKSIKGSGTATITLVPRRNYLNYLFPNDIVNIYFDPGDGERGFVRTFMGYIDRIERTETVNAQGTLETRFIVQCTDIVKAIDRTEIYFNQQLALRQELFGDFAQSNLGGLALQGSGIKIHGTPSDVVENFMQILLGFGAQWALPPSYPKQYLETARTRRLQRAISKIPSDISNRIQKLGYVDITKTSNISELDKLVADLKRESGAFNITENDFSGTEEGKKKFAEAQLRRKEVDAILDNQIHIDTIRSILRDINTGVGPTIMDILDLSFIEAMTIDGYIVSETIWQYQGTLASALYRYCNEIVNELFMDLRPVAKGDDSCFGTIYSKEPDEFGINSDGTEDFPPQVAAVQYRPALVLREYPYSVVEGLDLTRYSISAPNNRGDKGNIGFVPFGPIFAEGINQTGRHIYDYQTSNVPPLTPVRGDFNKDAKAQRHIDSVTIYNTDVTHSQLGRSDNDIYNLFELYSNGIGIEDYKWMMSDIFPIMTPVSILRNGLRLKQSNTSFAAYYRDAGTDNLRGTIDDANGDGQVRKNLIRWTLLMDSWAQHNLEYLSGTIVLRGMPEIRVGYRLDWEDHSESYYVDSVNHTWTFPDILSTTLTVSRGQRNDPLPAYIPPMMPQFAESQDVSPTKVDVAPQETTAPTTDLSVMETLQRNSSNKYPLVTHSARFKETFLNSSGATIIYYRKDPSEFAAEAGVDVETYSLARSIRSEGYGGAASGKAYAAVAIGQALVNLAASGRRSITAMLTNSTAKLAGTDLTPADNYYGNQLGRRAATTSDPTQWHIDVATAVLAKTVPDFVNGATQFIDPRTHESGKQGDSNLKSPEKILNKRITEGNVWIGNIPMISTWHLMFFRPESSPEVCEGCRPEALKIFELGRAGKSTTFGVAGNPTHTLADVEEIEAGETPGLLVQDKKTGKVGLLLDAKALGGGNRSIDSRLSRYFKIKDTFATLRTKAGSPTPGAQENELDKIGEANFGQSAEYAMPLRASRQGLQDFFDTLDAITISRDSTDELPPNLVDEYNKLMAR
jgi:hypothetical protein